MGLEHLGLDMNRNPTIQREGTLLIAGSARTVFDDLNRILGNDGDYYRHRFDVMCLNDMVMHYPGQVDHAYSNEHQTLPKWVAARRPRYLKDFQNKILQHTCQTGLSYQCIWHIPGHGTSGLNAVYVGLGMGYDKIILAGVPIDGTGHYFEPEWKKTNYEKMMRYWDNANKHVFDGKVKSLSGLTRELLGEP